MPRVQLDRMCFVGVDPGSSGAVCALNLAGEVIHVDKLPTLKARRGKTIINFPLLVQFLRELPRIRNACVEDIWAQPNQGVKAAFSYGYNYALLITALEHVKAPIEFILPSIWQKRYKVPKGKKSSVHIAKQFYPQHDKQVGNNDNKAESMLMARYCWEKYRA